MDVGDEIVGDFGNGDIVYVQFIPLDEKEEQVERTFKFLKADPEHAVGCALENSLDQDRKSGEKCPSIRKELARRQKKWRLEISRSCRHIVYYHRYIRCRAVQANRDHEWFPANTNGRVT
jgi:hypothetical protein